MDEKPMVMEHEAGERLHDLSLRAWKAQCEVEERACEVLAMVLGDGWAARTVSVRHSNGAVFLESHELHVDEQPVWRLWWKQAPEGGLRYSLHTEWLVAPESLAS